MSAAHFQPPKYQVPNSDINFREITPTQQQGHVNEYMNYTNLDKKIFKDLFNSLLKQTILESSNFDTGNLLLNLENFASECIDSFYRVLKMLKFSASQDTEGNSLSAPYGRFAISPTAIFLNIAVSYGLNHAELNHAKLLPVLSILRKFTGYELMLSYKKILTISK